MNQHSISPPAASPRQPCHNGFHLAFYQPEIPANTGNAMRLAANCGCLLHLIQPLGFVLDDRKLRRAGMDYREIAQLRVHRDLQSLRQALPAARLLAFTTKGEQSYSDWHYQAGDILLFGPESRGLPAAVLEQADARLRIPMITSGRSLNLSNSAAIALYEAWRQQGFATLPEQAC
ncbi:MAG: tRNA (cytidine(34)-2'-O)-methyltransferase [Wenzhouxiangellaceae bacterium]